MPGFAETRWIVSEDVNVEHLIDVFTSIETDAPDAWGAFAYFVCHLRWQKPRRTMLGLKIEGLPDDHPFKALCLLRLSQLFGSIGNYPEQKRLLSHALTVWREQGNDYRVAGTLRFLSYVNRELGLFGEGIQQAEEAFKISKQLGDTEEQAMCLGGLASLLIADNQLGAAEDATFQIIDLLPEKGEEFELCRSHKTLGRIYGSKGEKENAIHHFKTALTIASPFDWPDELFWIHFRMSELFRSEDESNDANAHIEQAKSHAVDNPYNLGCGMKMQARIWYQQRRLEDARSEAVRALESFEKLGATKDAEGCKGLLWEIEEAMESGISGDLNPGGEFPSRDTASHHR